MLKLTESKGGVPEATTFEVDDLIELFKDRAGRLTLKVIRDANTESARFLFLGENLHACLATQISSPIEDAWKILSLLLGASWVLTEISIATEECILARVVRIATCPEEADPRPPCCDAGGDGCGRD